jgi:hypothetical protein
MEAYDIKILGQGHLEIVRWSRTDCLWASILFVEPRLSAYPLVAGIAEGGWGSLPLSARARRLEDIMWRNLLAYHVEEKVAPYVAQELELLAQRFDGGVEVGMGA